MTGMVPFAIGSETCGSITYPASRCGVTALRPTFGTVGRTGVMSISESLVRPLFLYMLYYFWQSFLPAFWPRSTKQDKLGPFCRTAEDCAIILDIIRGKDPDDLSSIDMPLGDPFSVDLTKVTVGYLEDAEKEVTEHDHLFILVVYLYSRNKILHCFSWPKKKKIYWTLGILGRLSPRLVVLKDSRAMLSLYWELLTQCVSV